MYACGTLRSVKAGCETGIHSEATCAIKGQTAMIVRHRHAFRSIARFRKVVDRSPPPCEVNHSLTNLEASCILIMGI